MYLDRFPQQEIRDDSVWVCLTEWHDGGGCVEASGHSSEDASSGGSSCSDRSDNAEQFRELKNILINYMVRGGFGGGDSCTRLAGTVPMRVCTFRT